MKTLLTIYAFTMGICIGSFLNVLIYRMPLHLNVAKGRSFCPSCQHQLGALDLIPLFSYLFLGRKCRYCKSKISPRYFTIELITGFLYLMVVIFYYPNYRIFIYLIIISLLIVIIAIDYKTKLIPPVLSIIIAGSSLIYIAIFDVTNIVSYVMSALFIATPFMLASIIAKLIGKKALGMGDIKLSLALGLSVPLGDSIQLLYLTLLCIFVKIFVIIICKFVAKMTKYFDVNKSFAFADVISVAYILYIFTVFI